LADRGHTGSENAHPKADLENRSAADYLKLKPQRLRSDVIPFDMVIVI
jgi:hypothetical protein